MEFRRDTKALLPSDSQTVRALLSPGRLTETDFRRRERGKDSEHLWEAGEGDKSLMDGGFDGPRTAEAARENGFDAHFTMLSGSKAMGSAADFQLDDENRSVLECPNKVVPEESHYLEKSQSVSVQMKTSACAECPKRSECPGGKAFDRLAVDAAKKAQAAASSEAGKSSTEDSQAAPQ